MGLSVTVRPLIDSVNPNYLAGTPYSFANGELFLSRTGGFGRRQRLLRQLRADALQ